MLLIAMARSFSGGVTQSQGEEAILGVFFPIENALYRPYSSINFTTKDRYGLIATNYFEITRKVNYKRNGEIDN